MLKITGDVCESYEIRILCSINPDIASNLNTDPDPGPEPAFFFTLPEIYLDPDPYCDYGTYHVEIPPGPSFGNKFCPVSKT